MKSVFKGIWSGVLVGLAAIVCMEVYSQQFVRVHHLSTTVAAPQIVTVTSTPTTVFTSNPSITEGRVILRTIQNTGTQPVLYRINGTVSASDYHGVIAGGSVNRDGNGALVEFSRVPGTISLMTESGSSTVALVELTQ